MRPKLKMYPHNSTDPHQAPQKEIQFVDADLGVAKYVIVAE